jgi:uncharacterized membrane protein
MVNSSEFEHVNTAADLTLALNRTILVSVSTDMSDKPFRSSILLPHFQAHKLAAVMILAFFQLTTTPSSSGNKGTDTLRGLIGHRATYQSAFSNASRLLLRGVFLTAGGRGRLRNGELWGGFFHICSNHYQKGQRKIM